MELEPGCVAENGLIAKGDRSTQSSTKASKSLAQDPQACSLNHQDKDLCHTTDFWNLALSSIINSTKHFSYPLIKVFVPDVSICSSHKVHSLRNIMSDEPPPQFDGLYNIVQVFGSVFKFNELPAQFPPLREHGHFFRDYASTTAKK